ncbi:bifunctional methylenetetrahydrofolate dehydrogenase/methenyltetrahydrofolate cyclohydrolase FolD [Caldicellulosiruptor naganoensis]|uniref:Bifunctional protein FolD n=2 Tax=Caldicellulosiruptor naganoensis TaxID=29324 RepID=A0ABY7BLW8_9FIRM|nr:bifunctional methylenetetrahydrofolate dehydrogenase/methenyltetrahydrofolate cyclohydrolase FolD [Caldicellulosiruptor naganoensis]WAM32556.1 bifunctional methylenetetrahydrofolate dehydrogenase/methenyltetrahydrofolate cyclohydrolase FolD [Caldicellulosiruptor naganoensis]
MTANIIDGRKIAQMIKDEVKIEIAKLKEKGIESTLAVVIVGDDPASRSYVNSKKKTCSEVGINSIEYALDSTTTQEDLENLIERLNQDPKINGILVQLPLPNGLDEARVCKKILPQKDVDGFHPMNVGMLTTGIDFEYSIKPCTPFGVIELLKRENIEIRGKHAVVIGRSNIVGKPLALLLLRENATVTICHSHTKNLKEICKTADILVAAVGKPKFVTADMVKEGAVVIDVGINRDETSKKIVGDVDFEVVKEVASYITPVPGGVGPMTVAMLMKNTLFATLLQNGLL